MESWRWQKGDYHHQETQGTRSIHRKPINGSWQLAVPSWEKKFCTSVGSVPWRKLLETKKIMYLYDNVVQWNDSAGEEAFCNAKIRFWAEINGLPCDLCLPDPDCYIDEIDWDSSTDPQLLMDLEQEPNAPDESNKGVILGASLLLNQSFSCIGWGDAEEKKGTLAVPKFRVCDRKVCEKNSWEENCDPKVEWDNNQNGRDNYNKTKNMDAKRIDRVWGAWDENNRKSISNWHMSRYKTSRFKGDNYQMNHGWRNERGRKEAAF